MNEDLLLRSWITGAPAADFRRRVEHLTALLRPGTGPVLVAESNPLVFLAEFFAALLAGRPVVIGSFAWAEREWARAEEILGGDGMVFATDGVGCSATGSRAPGADLRPGEILIPTGGSSGALRFARHSWETLAAAAEGFRTHFGGGAVDSLCVLPLYHVSGLMQAVRSLMSGGTFIPLEWQRVAQGEVPFGANQFLSLVPTQLHRLLARECDLTWMRELKAIPLGGAAASAALLEKAAEQRLPIALSYGMTETAAMVTALRPEEFAGGRRDCGSSLPHAQVRVGARGSIRVKSASLFCGYAPGDAGAGEWWETGDVGSWSPEGGLEIAGRAGRWIVTGGEKVSLDEVEEVLKHEAGVKEVTAFGVEDPEWGQALAAAYVPGQGGQSIDARRALAGRLMPHKIPKFLFPLEELPRTAAGKIDRARLEQIAGRGLVEER